MKKALGMLCALTLVMAMLYGMHTLFASSEQESPSHDLDETINSEESVTEPPQEKDEIIINKVHVTEQPLSEINTEESDPFAKCYGSSQHFLVSDNDIYTVFPGNSAEYYQYFENLGDEPAYVWLPQTDDFITHVVIDNVIYGTEHAYSWYSAYITRYKDGVGERLTDDPVEGCYFAEEGIYYQSGNKIFLMDYNGQNSELIVQIPDLLYVDSISSNFIVYRGKLWYAYGDPFGQYDYPLWCYDFEGTFTRFDNGRLDAVNNGYLYYKVIDLEYYDRLYRFNCETYSTELIDYDVDVLTCSFCQNYVLYNDFESLYRLDSNGSEIILSADQIKRGTGILGVGCSNDRIFVQGADDPEDFWEIEIDIDGKIITTNNS